MPNIQGIRYVARRENHTYKIVDSTLCGKAFWYLQFARYDSLKHACLNFRSFFQVNLWFRTVRILHSSPTAISKINQKIVAAAQSKKMPAKPRHSMPASRGGAHRVLTRVRRLSISNDDPFESWWKMDFFAPTRSAPSWGFCTNPQCAYWSLRSLINPPNMNFIGCTVRKLYTTHAFGYLLVHPDV